MFPFISVCIVIKHVGYVGWLISVDFTDVFKQKLSTKCRLAYGKLFVHLYKHYINHNQTLFTLTFRSLSETFIRRSCSFLLLVLAAVVMWCGKKSLVCVAHCIAALVPVHRMLSLLSEVHCFLNPSVTSIRLPIQDCRFWPVDYMVVMFACLCTVSYHESCYHCSLAT